MSSIEGIGTVQYYRVGIPEIIWNFTKGHFLSGEGEGGIRRRAKEVTDFLQEEDFSLWGGYLDLRIF